MGTRRFHGMHQHHALDASLPKRTGPSRVVLSPKMHALLAIAALPVSAIVLAFLNWSALRPWRRSRNEHWTEQARRLWPVNVTAHAAIWTMPPVAVLSLALFRPDTPQWSLFATGVACLVGTMAGTLPLNREIFPRLGWSELLRQSAVGLCLHLLLWIVLAAVALAMPSTFGWPALALGVAMLALQLSWARSGWLRFGRLLGLFVPAPERLQHIVDTVSARTGVQCRAVWVMRIGTCQALALPLSRELVFSDRLIEAMPDEEIAAICAHELGHLTESRVTLCLRLVRATSVLPWIYLIPLLHTLGAIGLYIPLLLMVLVPRLTASLVRRLETCADNMATANESVTGAYARALLRLSEDNLTPVVFPGKGVTHPHTYDRVLAAGVTPDFPRPKAPATMSWHGFILSGILGAELACFAIQYLR